MAARPEIPELPLSMRRVEVLQGVMVTKIFNAILQWPGFTARNLVDLLIDSLPRVQDCLADLVGAGLLIVIPVWELRDGTLVSLKRPEINEENPIIREFHMYYGSKTAAIYVGGRDGSSLKRIRTRIEEDIRGDHNDGRPKFRHTLKLNDCVVALSLGGFRPFAGYRGSLFIPGGSQLVPDAWMLVRVEIPLRGIDGREVVVHTDLNVFIEYERSATSVAAIRRKLRKYLRAAAAGIKTPVWFICETERAMHIFRQEHERLQRETRVRFALFTTTYAEVVAGIRSGAIVMMNGRPVRMW